MSPPCVSFIIPCFNQAHFLDESVRSALRAYAGPSEIVIVDDGSTAAATPRHLKAAAALSENVTVIRQENGGLSAARNAGLAVANGDFIQFLDADDLLLDQKVERQIRQFKVNPDLDIAVCSYVLCDEIRTFFTGSTVPLARFDFGTKDFLFHWERGFSIPIHCALFRREAIGTQRFEVDLRAKEDWVFWSKLALRGARIGYLPLEGVAYRQHTISMRQSRARMGYYWLKAAQRIDDLAHSRYPDFVQQSIRWFKEIYERDFLDASPDELAVSGAAAATSKIAASNLDASPRGTTDSPSSEIATAHLREAAKEPAAEIEGLRVTLAGCTPAHRTSEPLIDIVIPVYNHAKHLSCCIASAVNQSVRPHRIICIDDASTEPDVGRILTAFEQQFPDFVEIIRLQENLGISRAQNLAVGHSDAEFVAFLDCDDQLQAEALQTVSEQLCRTPDIDYAFTDRIDIDESDAPLGIVEYGGYPHLRPRGHYEALLDGMVASHLKVIRRAKYQEVGGCDDAVSGVQDWDLALKIAQNGKLLHVAAPLYLHRQHSNSVTLSSRVPQFRKTNIVRRKFTKQRFVRTGLEIRPAVVARAVAGADAGGPDEIDIYQEVSSLDRLRQSWRENKVCAFVLQDAENVPRINFVREYNSYFDVILCRAVEPYFALLGYLWDDQVLVYSPR